MKFPTRISYQSCTLIDNIFINIYNHDFSVHPLINCLSDHDGQIITFSTIAKSVPRHLCSITREINSHTIQNFTLLLSYENWEDVFLEKDVNILVGNPAYVLHNGIIKRSRQGLTNARVEDDHG